MSEGIRVIVCGGRSYSDQPQVDACLDELHAIQSIALLIEGGANGADMCAKNWAVTRRVEWKCVPADWQKHGKAAGPIRNRAMLALKPDLVVCFPGGRGTQNMGEQALAAGVRVLVWPR